MHIAAIALALLANASALCPGWTVATLAPAIAAGPEPLMADFDGDGRADVVTWSDGVRIRYGGNRDETLFAGTNVGGLAVGDYDRDGRPDLVFDAQGALQLLLNRGGRFDDPRPRALAPLKAERLANADFNGDGNLDVIALQVSSRRFVLLFGDGRGGFGSPLPVDPGSPASTFAAGDFNGDGKDDLAFADAATADRVALFAGDGAGNFQLLSEASLTGGRSSMTAADLDGDGRDELIVTQNLGAVTIIRPTGRPIDITVNRGAAQVIAADFDRDGSQDLAVVCTANGGQPAIIVLLNDGIGRFRRVPDLPTEATGIAAFALPGEAPDLAVVTAAGVIVAEGNGDGTFRGPLPLAPVSGPLHAADLDGDGDDEIIAGSVMPGVHITIFWNENGRFEPYFVRDANKGFYELQFADLDGDGVVEMIGVQPEENQFFRTLPRRIVLFPIEHHAAVLGTSWEDPQGEVDHIVAGDFDGDGRAEVISQSDRGMRVVGFRPDPIVLAGIAAPVGATMDSAGDFDGDALLDLVNIRHGSTFFNDYTPKEDGYVTIRRNLGKLAFGPDVLVIENIAPYQLFHGDFDGDGQRDLAVMTSPAALAPVRTYVLYGVGDAFAGKAIKPEVLPLPIIATADLDGDGRVEVMASRGERVVILHLVPGAAPRELADLPATAYPFAQAIAANLDRSGGLDLLIRSNTSFLSAYWSSCGTVHRRAR